MGDLFNKMGLVEFLEGLHNVECSGLLETDSDTTETEVAMCLLDKASDSSRITLRDGIREYLIVSDNSRDLLWQLLNESVELRKEGDRFTNYKYSDRARVDAFDIVFGVDRRIIYSFFKNRGASVPVDRYHSFEALIREHMPT